VPLSFDSFSVLAVCLSDVARSLAHVLFLRASHTFDRATHKVSTVDLFPLLFCTSTNVRRPARDKEIGASVPQLVRARTNLRERSACPVYTPIRCRLRRVAALSSMLHKNKLSLGDRNEGDFPS
jgi:hypothetical protein